MSIDEGVPKTRKVVIAVDLSEHAERAFRYYFQNLHRPENEVVLFHSADQPNLPTFSFKGKPMTFPVEEWMVELEKRREEIAKLESDYEYKLLQEKVKYKMRVSFGGDLRPGEAIVQAADEEQASMVVIGTRGLGTIRRTLLGSVSDYVVRHAKCTVVICPPAVSNYLD